MIDFPWYVGLVGWSPYIIGVIIIAIWLKNSGD